MSTTGVQTMTEPSKTAYARRIDGNLYDVTYSDDADMDRAVPYSYLRRLEASGYRIEHL